ncbi:MAG TPA: ABC transporter permease, partial [Ilumatobacter sp.]|nr:ABC transporter permease [Ilumatobacter sp.]
MRTMLKLSIRSLTAHKLRFSLTTFAVILGVSFVVASFVLTDGLTRTFDTIVEDANSEVDVEIRARDEFAEVDLGDRPMDESVLDIVQGVDGVREAIPITMSLKVIPLKADGSTIETLAPIFAFNWQDTELDALELVAGEYPDGPGEFALDVTTADNEGFVIGQTYDIVGINGREPFELVGVNRFGEENALAGAVLSSFTLDELQRLDGSEGQILFVDISADVETQVLIDRLTDVLPPDVEAVTGDVVVSEGKQDFSAVVDIFGNVLLAFALIAVFVSTFIISNTFNILLGQRVRELALLRALGASSRQVRFSSLLESLIVGVIASIVGLGGGVLLALGLRSVMGW